MITLIDTHSHLYLPEFSPQEYDTLINRAKESGVERIYLPNVDMDTVEPMLNLCNLYPNICKPMIGLHPEAVDNNFRSKLNKIEELLKTGEFIAIGETGIDLYWDTTYRQQQMESFEQQILWAKQYRLPLIIHQRNSYNEVVGLVKKYAGSDLKGIFHCFTGNIKQAMEIIELGFYVGIGGIVTFKNAGLDKTVAQIPVEKILLETDSPYLSPVPYRGKRNESAYLIFTARKIAELKNIPVEELAGITTRQALVLFEKNET